MRGFTLVLFLATIGIGWHFTHARQLSPRALPARALGSANEQTDPCAGKERCVVLYVAPWCPACKATLPQYTKLRETWKSSSTRGVKFIVGADRIDKTAALVAQIGEGAFVDVGDKFMHEMNVTHFPTVWIIDGDKKVLETDQSAVAWLNQDFARHR